MKIKFHAVVCKSLTSEAIGGTNFLKENGIEQDFTRDVIYMDNRKISILPTKKTSILPMVPLLEQQVNKLQPSSQLLTFKSRILLPDQEISVPVKMTEGSVIAIHPWEQNENMLWPNAQLQTVRNKRIWLKNETTEPIHLGKDVKLCKLSSTEEPQSKPSVYYQYKPQPITLRNTQVVPPVISMDNVKTAEAKNIIYQAHEDYQNIFDKDLTTGYNGFYGKHHCRLNWATNERPTADKVRVPRYNHALKALQQELMDDLTDQNVLLIPQDHNIKVQSVQSAEIKSQT